MYSEMKNNNKGFTLVELIVCVGILAAVAIPLAQSFSASSIANSKAQSLQNATSLAEDVMEKVKTKTLDDLGTEYGKFDPPAGMTEATFFAATDQGTLANTFKSSLGSATKGLFIWPSAASTDPDFWVLYDSDTTATNAGGETFDVVASISKNKYYAKDPTTGAPIEADDASDANSIRLPKLEEIDTGCHVSLSKELNRFDISAAADVSDQYSAGSSTGTASSVSASTVASTGTKTIQIDMAGDATSKVTVDVTVIYSDGVKKVQYKVFTGTFNVDLTAGLYQPNIYLFYTPMSSVSGIDPSVCFANESIVFNDMTTGTYPSGLKDPVEIKDLDTSMPVRHDLYLILEGGNRKLSDTGRNITVKMTQGALSAVAPANLGNVFDFNDDTSSMQIPVDTTTNLYGNRMFSNVQVGADSDVNEYDKFGKPYSRKKKNRVYQVNVVLTKNGADKVYAELESTKDAEYKP